MYVVLIFRPLFYLFLHMYPVQDVRFLLISPDVLHNNCKCMLYD
ncbi:hypothetical protein EUBVEN_02459 [Eubacterium ventriosum ATCC 27560]|uniref:Uncharacterized protein n=1 Tax=Eubacterium ventriosum ATCC 27560 TaxID=411463 RepID=A5Z9R3_9FIRM|nr:hypothetical protein EUBVEN_02459 [Eubacterium ventriosum ATCC 27560]